MIGNHYTTQGPYVLDWLNISESILRKNISDKCCTIYKVMYLVMLAVWSWVTSPRLNQGHQFFLTFYFWFQNLIADVKSFSKHYNKIIFHEILFELWGLKLYGLKVTVLSALALCKVSDRWLKPLECLGSYSG